MEKSRKEMPIECPPWVNTNPGRKSGPEPNIELTPINNDAQTIAGYEFFECQNETIAPQILREPKTPYGFRYSEEIKGFKDNAFNKFEKIRKYD